MGAILVVCTGNICRSPVAEAALQANLPDGITVSSAGTHAALGRTAVPETDEFVSRKLGFVLDHNVQQLSNQHVDAADLILTMTTEQREWVAREAPRAVRRTFTLRELDQILALSSQGSDPETVRSLALEASRLRSRVGTAGVDLDITDPYGGTAEGYDSSFQQVLASALRIADAISRYTSEI